MIIIAEFLDVLELLRLNCTYKKAYNIIVPQVMDQRDIRLQCSLFTKLFSPDSYDIKLVQHYIDAPFNFKNWPGKPDYSEAFTTEEDSVRKSDYTGQRH